MKLNQIALRWARQMSLCALAVTSLTATSNAVDLEKETALRLAPADASFFSSRFQLSRGWKSFYESKPVQEALSTTAARSIEASLRKSWEEGNGQIGMIKQQMNNPMVTQLLTFGQDLMSQEFFAFGDAQLPQFLITISSASNEFIREVSAAPDAEVIKSVLLDEDFTRGLKGQKTPTFVMGFKIANRDTAEILVQQMYGLALLGSSQIPGDIDLNNAIEQIDDERGSRVAIQLNGGMIPWDDIRQDPGMDEEIAEALEDIFAEKQICISIGLVDDYFVFAMSDSAEEIAQLGTSGGDSLLSQPDLAAIRAASDKDLFSIDYISDDFAQANFEINLKDYWQKNFTNISTPIALEMDPDDEFTVSLLDQLKEDVVWLDSEMDKLVPEFKGTTGYAYYEADAESGVSGVTESRSPPVVFDGSKPIELLNHVGRSPIAMVATRKQYHPEYFALAREVVQKAVGYIKMYRDSEEASENDKREIDFVLNSIYPKLKEAADVIESKFMPALKDGQFAWVFSKGKLASEQWWMDMPIADEPLPLPECAIVVGVTDQDMLLDGYDSLFSLADDIVEIMKENEDIDLPEEFSVPRPVEGSVGSALQFKYPIPEECPVPESMAPQAVFLGDAAIYSYSTDQSLLLSQDSQLQIAPWMFKSGENLLGAGYLDVGRIFEFATPWVRYGILQANGSLEDYVIPEADPFPGVTGKDVLQLWRALSAFGEHSSKTVVTDNGTTTYWNYRE